MNSKIKKFLIIVIILFATISLCACSSENNEDKNRIYEYLEEKYNDEFYIERRTDNSSFGYTAPERKYLCRSKETNILFEVYIFSSTNEIRDDYDERILEEEIEEDVIKQLSLIGIETEIRAFIHEANIFVKVPIKSSDTYLETVLEIADLFKIKQEELDTVVIATIYSVDDSDFKLFINDIKNSYEPLSKTQITSYYDYKGEITFKIESDNTSITVNNLFKELN